MKIADIVSRQVPALRLQHTVGEAQALIRTTASGYKFLYFYVVDEQQRLQGVIPARLLLTSPLETRLQDILNRNLVTLRMDMDQTEAIRTFATQKFLALPVVDDLGHLQGVVDVEQLGGEVGDVHSRTGFDDVYELLGLRLSPSASAWEAYLKRFPWLLTTIAAGTACALLAGFFESTIQQLLMLAFFMTLVLGLNEAVAMQSVTLAIQTLHTQPASKAAWFQNWKKEVRTALLIGLSCAVVVGGISIWWSSEDLGSKILAISLTVSLCLSSTIGLTVPYVLHQKPQWSKVAAAPVSLALADLMTLTVYFSTAKWMLSP